ncbi:MAG TPA: hypothetical protein VM529_06970, partial [Gemmata sp.]|nr:hypothetical protein [Gemmata sp.]
GAPRRWEDFDRVALALADKLKKNEGEGFYVLAEQTPSPALRLIREHVKAAYPKASWHTYEPVDPSEALTGAVVAFGKPLVAKYNFDKLDRVLALDCDFLGTEANAVENSRAFAQRRTVEKAGDTMNRLYVVESTYTVTGTMADHRLRLPASQIGGYLLAVAKELKVAGLPNAADAAAVPEKWVKEVAKDLLGSKGKAAVVVGHRQPAWVHALAHAVNAALGATPAIVELRTPPPEVLEKGVRELTRDMAAGKVNTLLIVGGNPALNAPADANFANELQKVATKIRLGLFHDQTSVACDWHLPLAHPLESWGDSETSDGTLCCVQPLIAPLNGARSPGASEVEPPPRGGRTALEVLALLTQFKNPADGKAVTSYLAAQKAAYAAVRKAFADRATLDKGETADAAFNKYKQLGFLPADKDKAARKPEAAQVNAAEVAKAVAGYAPTPAPTKDALEVTFHPDATLYDGRFAMNPWLQELPDPITKIVWDNAAVLSPKTAAEFGVDYGDRVKLTVNGVALDIPVFVLPGQADYSVALAYGQFSAVWNPPALRAGKTFVPPPSGTRSMRISPYCP